MASDDHASEVVATSEVPSRDSKAPSFARRLLDRTFPALRKLSDDHAQGHFDADVFVKDAREIVLRAISDELGMPFDAKEQDRRVQIVKAGVHFSGQRPEIRFDDIAKEIEVGTRAPTFDGELSGVLDERAAILKRFKDIADALDALKAQEKTLTDKARAIAAELEESRRKIDHILLPR